MNGVFGHFKVTLGITFSFHRGKLCMWVPCLLTYMGIYYHIAQNCGGGKFWRIYHFEGLAGKTLANCNELSLFSPVQ